MNASSPITTTVQVALSIGATFVARQVFGWPWVGCIAAGVIGSYPLTLIIVALAGAVAEKSPPA